MTTVNTAAARLLGLAPDASGRLVHEVLDKPEVQPLATLLAQVAHSRTEPAPQEIAIVSDGREMHLAAVASALHGESGAPEGAVLVFDDVTPSIRSQKVAAWREVARRLAHEIKNPLTPIQLSRRTAPAPFRQRSASDAGAGRRVHQRRSSARSSHSKASWTSSRSSRGCPRLGPSRRRSMRSSTKRSALYEGLFAGVRFERRYDPQVHLVRLDAEQVRRVVINLIDNAVEAMERRGTIWLETELDSSNSLVRIIVSRRRSRRASRRA